MVAAWVIALAVSVASELAGNAGAFDSNQVNPHGLDEYKSCGLRCCMFVDHYLGGEHSYIEVLNSTPVSSRGSNLADVAMTLRSFGYSVKAVKCNAKYLRSVNSPAVVAVRRGDLDHFIVTLQYDSANDSFLAFDPPRKLENTSYESLADEFRGYVLVVSIPDGETSTTAVPNRGAIGALFIGLGFVGLVWLWSRRRDFQRSSKGGTAISALLLAAILAVLGCRPSIAKGGPEAESPSPSTESLRRNVGRVAQGAPVSIDFAVRNTSNVPFDIVDTTKSCSCQSLRFSKTKDVQPDETVRVTIDINTTGKSGHISGDVVVITNSRESNLREIPLSIEGEIVSLVRVIPSQVSFGDVDCGSTHRKALRVEAFSSGIARTLASVSSSEAALTPSFKIINDDLIEVDIDASFDHRVAGEIFGRNDLHFDHPTVGVVPVEVNARVRSRIRAIPRVVTISGHESHWSRRLRVEATDGAEFKVLSIDSPDGVATSWKPDRAKSFMIELAPEKASEGLAGGMHTLSISTDLTGSEQFRVPFLVQLRP